MKLIKYIIFVFFLIIGLSLEVYSFDEKYSILVHTQLFQDSKYAKQFQKYVQPIFEKKHPIYSNYIGTSIYLSPETVISTFKVNNIIDDLFGYQKDAFIFMGLNMNNMPIHCNITPETIINPDVSLKQGEKVLLKKVAFIFSRKDILIEPETKSFLFYKVNFDKNEINALPFFLDMKNYKKHYGIIDEPNAFFLKYPILDKCFIISIEKYKEISIEEGKKILLSIVNEK